MLPINPALFDLPFRTSLSDYLAFGTHNTSFRRGKHETNRKVGCMSVYRHLVFCFAVCLEFCYCK